MDKLKRERYKVWIGGFQNNIKIWGSFKMLIDFIFDKFPESNRRFEQIALPLLFIISHAVELGLKENINHLKKYSESNTLSKFENWVALAKSHDLKCLAKEFKSQFNKTCKKLRVDNDIKLFFNKFYEKLEWLIEELNRNAETFRYSDKIDKHGKVVKKSIALSKEVDFYEIQEKFIEVNNLLIHVSDALGCYTDYVDIIKIFPEYKKIGNGYLYSPVIPIGSGFESILRERLDKEMIRKEDDKWFDSERGESLKMKIHGQFIYLISVK